LEFSQAAAVAVVSPGCIRCRPERPAFPRSRSQRRNAAAFITEVNPLGGSRFSAALHPMQRRNSHAQAFIYGVSFRALAVALDWRQTSNSPTRNSESFAICERQGREEDKDCESINTREIVLAPKRELSAIIESKSGISSRLVDDIKCPGSGR